MICRLIDLRDKEVVNINNGCCLGAVSDVEIDTCCARVQALVIYGRSRLFGLMGREEDIIICWDNIKCIGEDTVLVNCAAPDRTTRRPQSVFERLFG